MVRLNLKISHRQIFPILFLFFLVMIVGDFGKVFRCDWWSAAKGCAFMVIIAIVPFYIGLPLGNRFYFKKSWLGLGLSTQSTMRILIAFWIFLTYFAFIWRILIICAVEAIFIGIILSTATIPLLDDPQKAPFWWCLLTLAIVFIHTFYESSKLGENALIIQDENNSPCTKRDGKRDGKRGEF